MGKLVNLTLLRLAPEVAQAGRGPYGRVAKVMAYLLAHGRGPGHARTALDYLRDAEPERLWELRDSLLALPEGEGHGKLEIGVAKLKRRVTRAIDACRRRWAMPVVHTSGDAYYLAVPDEPAGREELRRARRAMPREVASRFEADLRRLTALGRMLDGPADPTSRTPESPAAGRALRRWGLRPRVHGQGDEAWNLRCEYNGLATRLTSMARCQGGASPDGTAGARNG